MLKECVEMIDDLRAQCKPDEDILAKLYEMFRDNKISNSEFERILSVLGYEFVEKSNNMSTNNKKKKVWKRKPYWVFDEKIKVWKYEFDFNEKENELVYATDSVDDACEYIMEHTDEIAIFPGWDPYYFISGPLTYDKDRKIKEILSY